MMKEFYGDIDHFYPSDLGEKRVISIPMQKKLHFDTQSSHHYSALNSLSHSGKQYPRFADYYTLK